MAIDLEKYTKEEALNIMLSSNVTWTPLEMKWTDRSDNSDMILPVTFPTSFLYLYTLKFDPIKKFR